MCPMEQSDITSTSKFLYLSFLRWEIHDGKQVWGTETTGTTFGSLYDSFAVKRSVSIDILGHLFQDIHGFFKGSTAYLTRTNPVPINLQLMIMMMIHFVRATTTANE